MNGVEEGSEVSGRGQSEGLEQLLNQRVNQPAVRAGAEASPKANFTQVFLNR